MPSQHRLTFAARTGDYDGVVSLLCDSSVNPNTLDHAKNTPLHITTNPKIAKAILKDGRIDPNQKNDVGETPLIRALEWHRNAALVAALLSDPRVNPNLFDGRYTPFERACRLLNTGVVRVMAKCPLIAVHSTNSRGECALHHLTRISGPQFERVFGSFGAAYERPEPMAAVRLIVGRRTPRATTMARKRRRALQQKREMYAQAPQWPTNVETLPVVHAGTHA